MNAETPCKALEAFNRIQSDIPVSAIRMEIPRARAMIITTLIMSAVPSINAFTVSASVRPPTTAIMRARMKNQHAASTKYHSPSGRR